DDDEDRPVAGSVQEGREGPVAELGGERLAHALGPVDPGEVDDLAALAVLACHPLGGGTGQRRLPDPARPDQRDQPPVPQPVGHQGQLRLSPDGVHRPTAYGSHVVRPVLTRPWCTDRHHGGRTPCPRPSPRTSPSASATPPRGTSSSSPSTSGWSSACTTPSIATAPAPMRSWPSGSASTSATPGSGSSSRPWPASSPSPAATTPPPAPSPCPPSTAAPSSTRWTATTW